MSISGITWQGESIDDVEILPLLPIELVRVLTETNGWIVHAGALHIRGASLTPDWHSLRAAWLGRNSFSTLYQDLKPSDIPFAQDQIGDQFLMRERAVIRLSAETGEIEPFATSLEDFFRKMETDLEGHFNIGLKHRMEPGQLLHAYPPFCFEESGASASLRALPASEVILFHADLARQIRDLPDGGTIEFKIKQ